MTKLLHHLPPIRDSLDRLIANDAFFSHLAIDYNRFDWPYMGGGFDGLVRIVAGQQVSTSAAKAIRLRTEAAIDPLTPENLIKHGVETLRACGFSRPKAGYIIGAAEAVQSGALDMDALAQKDEQEITAALTALKGFGPWSAQIYLMFGLARPDIWPAGDLGIQEGLRLYLGQEQRPDEAQTCAEGQRFKGDRTAAALLLWYTKGMGGF